MSMVVPRHGVQRALSLLVAVEEGAADVSALVPRRLGEEANGPLVPSPHRTHHRILSLLVALQRVGAVQHGELNDLVVRVLLLRLSLRLSSLLHLLPPLLPLVLPLHSTVHTLLLLVLLAEAARNVEGCVSCVVQHLDNRGLRRRRRGLEAGLEDAEQACRGSKMQGGRVDVDPQGRDEADDLVVVVLRTDVEHGEAAGVGEAEERKGVLAAERCNRPDHELDHVGSILLRGGGRVVACSHVKHGLVLLGCKQEELG
eukprot:758388-Hanusia_phi.AAC.3